MCVKRYFRILFVIVGFVVLTQILRMISIGQMAVERIQEAALSEPTEMRRSPAPEVSNPHNVLFMLLSRATALREGKPGADPLREAEHAMQVGQQHTLRLLYEGAMREVGVMRTKADAVLFTLGNGLPEGKLAIVGTVPASAQALDNQTARVVWDPQAGNDRQTIGWHEAKPEGYVFPANLYPLQLAQSLFAGIGPDTKTQIVGGSVADPHVETSRGRSPGRQMPKGAGM